MAYKKWFLVLLLGLVQPNRSVPVLDYMKAFVQSHPKEVALAGAYAALVSIPLIMNSCRRSVWQKQLRVGFKNLKERYERVLSRKSLPEKILFIQEEYRGYQYPIHEYIIQLQLVMTYDHYGFIDEWTSFKQSLNELKGQLYASKVYQQELEVKREQERKKREDEEREKKQAIELAAKQASGKPAIQATKKEKVVIYERPVVTPTPVVVHHERPVITPAPVIIHEEAPRIWSSLGDPWWLCSTRHHHHYHHSVNIINKNVVKEKRVEKPTVIVQPATQSKASETKPAKKIGFFSRLRMHEFSGADFEECMNVSQMPFGGMLGS